jgi:hypothetical protein
MMQYLVDTRFDTQVFHHANEELPDGSKVLYLREPTFYLKTAHEVIETRLDFDDARNPDKMLGKLRRLGYTHVIIEMDMMSTFNVLDAILDELPYDGQGGVVGEGELRYAEFDYWPLAVSVHADREMTADVLPAVIDVFGGDLIDPTPKAERYRLDLSPLRVKQYLTAYASLASELMPWHAEGEIGTGWFAGNTRMFDIREPSVREDEKYIHEPNEEN